MKTLAIFGAAIVAAYLAARGIEAYFFFCFTRKASGKGRWKR